MGHTTACLVLLATFLSTLGATTPSLPASKTGDVHGTAAETSSPRWAFEPPCGDDNPNVPPGSILIGEVEEDGIVYCVYWTPEGEIIRVIKSPASLP